MLKNKYKLGKIEIEPNYGDKWDYTSSKDLDFILIGADSSGEDNCFAVDLAQAKFIKDSLNEIITYYENIPSVGNYIEVINGIFKGYFGTIFDIDNCDSKRPLVVKLDDNHDFNNCTCFVNFDDVKKANK